MDTLLKRESYQPLQMVMKGLLLMMFLKASTISLRLEFLPIDCVLLDLSNVAILSIIIRAPAMGMKVLVFVSSNSRTTAPFSCLVVTTVGFFFGQLTKPSMSNGLQSQRQWILLSLKIRILSTAWL